MSAENEDEASSDGSQRQRVCKFRTVVTESGRQLARRPEELCASLDCEDREGEGEGCWHEDTDCPCQQMESCQDCEVCVDGVANHYPWDELEMLRHGWADAHGNHWSGAKAFEDEVELKHHGLVTSRCKHFHTQAHNPSGGISPAVIPSPVSIPFGGNLGQSGRVTFGRKIQIREHSYNPDDKDPKKMQATGVTDSASYGKMEWSSSSGRVRTRDDSLSTFWIVAVPAVSLLLLIYFGRRIYNNS